VKNSPTVEIPQLKEQDGSDRHAINDKQILEASGTVGTSQVLLICDQGLSSIWCTGSGGLPPIGAALICILSRRL